MLEGQAIAAVAIVSLAAPGPEDVAIGAFLATRVGAAVSNIGSKLGGAIKGLFGKKERTVDVYVVPGSRTDSGDPYVGTTLEDSNRLNFSGDGRQRSPEDVVRKVPESQRRPAEQQEMNDRGGVDALDNQRNEIAECKWDDCGVTPPRK